MGESVCVLCVVSVLGCCWRGSWCFQVPSGRRHAKDGRGREKTAGEWRGVDGPGRGWSLQVCVCIPRKCKGWRGSVTSSMVFYSNTSEVSRCPGAWCVCVFCVSCDSIVSLLVLSLKYPGALY